MPPTQRNAPSAGAATDGIVPVNPPEDDILDVLSEFETGLESLKALYVQRQKLQSRIRDQEEQVKGRETALAQRAGEVERASQEQQRRAAELEQAKAQLDLRERALSQAGDRAKSLEDQARKLAKDAEAVSHLTASMDAKSKELDTARTAFKEERETHQKEWAVLTKQLEQAKEEAQKYAHHAMKLESGVEAKLEEAAAARDKAVAELADLQSKWAQEKAQAAKHQNDTADADKALAELRARHQEEVGSRDQLRKQLETAEARYQELAGARDELRKQLEATEARTKEEGGSHDELGKQLEAAEQAAGKANARAEALQAKLTALAGEVESLKEQASRKPAATKQLVSSSTASMLRRRQRLKVYRELVREQAVKVRKGGDALRKKMETCEQVLAQRAELATIRDRVLEGERRLQRRHAGSRAAVTLACVVAVFAVLAAMSWVLAREVAPATYMATSALKADGRARALNRAELEEWSHFHQALLNDPRFHETAADRFKRTGFPKLTTPEAVAELVRNDLTSENATAGEMQLHLKGEGSDKTQRTLETFTAALASQANGELTRRIDGAVTAVTLQATSADEPLDNTRMMYFVGILMVGITICGIFVLSIWKRLVGAKTAFEQDDVVSQALDDTKWAAFTAAAAAQQGSAAALRNKTARG
jgi:chromosome segregation ATPase